MYDEGRPTREHHTRLHFFLGEGGGCHEWWVGPELEFGPLEGTLPDGDSSTLEVVTNSPGEKPEGPAMCTAGPCMPTASSDSRADNITRRDINLIEASQLEERHT